ncbi:MAG: polysaccharide biosynthesis/export family protein [bacterium]
MAVARRLPGSGRRSCLIFAVLLSLQLLDTGCGRWPVQKRLSPPPSVDEAKGVRKVNVDPPPPYEYHIGPGDDILVRFFYYPDLLEPKIEVPSEGSIEMPLIGSVRVVGLTEKELNRLLREKYADRLKFPDLVARVTSRSRDAVYLDGAVSRGAGSMAYFSTLTLLDALKRGGMGAGGAMHSVILIRGINTPDFQTFRVDAVEMLNGKQKDIYLEPNDIIYVPTKFITDVNYFVDRYIDRVLGRHIAPALVFPQAYPYRGTVDYDVDVQLVPEAQD